MTRAQASSQPSRRGVAQPGQRACFGSRRSGVQISAPRPSFSRSTLATFLAIHLLASCPAAAATAFYTVRAGDNLSRIAYRLGTTVVELKRDNALKSDVIGIGKRLKIEKPFQVPRQESRDWQRPLARRGEILREFGPYKNEQGVLIPRTGVDVQTTVGSKVQAPHHGVIRYIGEQDGFGTLMIIEHGQRVSTVLAPLDASSLMWKVGEVVWRGDVLGKTAAPVEGELPYLHLELRRNDKAVSPAPLLE